MGTLSYRDPPAGFSRSPEGAAGKPCRMAILDVSLGEASPGPIYFLDPKVTRFGRSCTPAFTIQGRGKSRGLEVTPGPGAYSPEKAAPPHLRTPPAFSLGARPRPPRPARPAPAPNAYTLPPLWGSQVLTKPASPRFSVAGRPAPPRAPPATPGPGRYDSPDPRACRPRAPAFSMRGRARNPPPPPAPPRTRRAPRGRRAPFPA